MKAKSLSAVLICFALFPLLAVGGARAALPVAVPSTAGDWPLYGHDNARTNFNPDETTLSAGNVSQLVSRWQVNVGSNGTPSSSSPAVANGRLYVGSSASTGNNFFAFDAVSGSVSWSTSVGYVSAGCLNVGIGSSASVSGTVLSVGGGDSAYYGLNALTGAQLWRNSMNVGASGFAWESPLLAHGKSYLGMSSRCDNPSVRGEVRAVDMNTGANSISQYFVPSGNAGGGIWNSPALSPDGTKLVVVTGEDYGGYNGIYNRAVVSLDPNTLQILQSNQQGGTGQDADFGTTPVILSDSQGRTLVGANHKNGVFYAYDLANLNAGPIWSKSTGTDVGMMPAYDPTSGNGGTLFIAGSSNRIFAVDPATGTDRWPAVTVGTMHGNMALANGLIFVNTGSAGLKILSETNGTLLRTLTPANAGSANSGVAVSNGFIYWLSGSYINAWSLPVISTPTATLTATAISSATRTSTATNTATAIPTSTVMVTATPTAPAVLVGHVTWQGRPAQPNALQQMPITLTLRSALTEVNYPPTTTDASGYFTLTLSGVPSGTYSWRVKGPQFLANSGTVALPGSGSTSVEMGLLLTGDTNDDNRVNTQDFNIVRTSLGNACGDPSYDNRADLNGDCLVNIVDFNLMRANFGMGGAPPIGPGLKQK